MSKLALFGGEPVRKEPFHKWPIYGKEEEENLISVLRKNKWGVGKRVGVINQFENEFADYHGVSSAVACTNCTQALEVALFTDGVRPGDEVIVPAYTFVATASAAAKIGAVPIFADIDKDTLLIDPDSILSLISSKTKAIVPVHFAGQVANMEVINRIADTHCLLIIEDAAQAHGAKCKGISPGHRNPATFSFQYSKNMTAGEGGIIISNSEDFIERCWEHIWHGRKKGGLWYEHFKLTSNYRMTEWSAAVLLAQLGRLKEQTDKRTENADYLSSLLGQDGLLLPLCVNKGIDVHSRHLFPLRINRDLCGEIQKSRLIEALTAEGLPIMPGYGFPVYRNPAFLNGCWGSASLSGLYDYSNVRLPNAEEACSDVVWIIHHVLLGTKQDMNDIVAGINKVASHINELR